MEEEEEEEEEDEEEGEEEEGEEEEEEEVRDASRLFSLSFPVSPALHVFNTLCSLIFSP